MKSVASISIRGNEFEPQNSTARNASICDASDKFRRILLFTVMGFIATSAIRLTAATDYVTLTGSAAPDPDSPSRPWQSIEAAANSLPREGGTVSISSGLY